MASRTPRILIRLVSSANTGYFYTTSINPRNTTTKLRLRKYDPVARKTVEFKQEKIK
jgi:large subunit ribosomal protein L33